MLNTTAFVVPLKLIEQPVRDGGLELADLTDVEAAALAIEIRQAVERTARHVSMALAELRRSDLRRADVGRTGGADAARDATPAEIATEPDGVLKHLADGDLAATPETRRLAAAELDYRGRR